MICDDALDLAAEKIVQRIAHPDDDLNELRNAARVWLLKEMEKSA